MALSVQEPSLDTLDRLLRQAHGVTLADVVAASAPGESETLFWSGSWLDGFANAKSDIDLYLIGATSGRPGTPEITGPGFPPMLTTLTPGSLRWEITVVPPELIERVAAFLSEFDAELGYPTAWSDNLREFVHRLRIGLPVAHPQRFEEIRASLDFGKFRGYLTRYYHNLADSLLEDVLGLIASGDHISAFLAARRRMEAVVDIYLVTKGETNTRVDKWRWRKLLRSDGQDSEVAKRFLLCEGLLGEPADPEAQTRRCLRLADELLLEVL